MKHTCTKDETDAKPKWTRNTKYIMNKAEQTTLNTMKTKPEQNIQNHRILQPKHKRTTKTKHTTQTIKIQNYKLNIKT